MKRPYAAEHRKSSPRLGVRWQSVAVTPLPHGGSAGNGQTVGDERRRVLELLHPLRLSAFICGSMAFPPSLPQPVEFRVNPWYFLSVSLSRSSSRRRVGNGSSVFIRSVRDWKQIGGHPILSIFRHPQARNWFAASAVAAYPREKNQAYGESLGTLIATGHRPKPAQDRRNDNPECFASNPLVPINRNGLHAFGRAARRRSLDRTEE